VRIIREVLVDLLASAAIGLLLHIAVQELVRQPGVDTAMLGGMVPVTAQKWPWVLVIAALLLILWLAARALGGPRGVLWGAWRWLVRLGLWWSATALLLFIGVAVYGACTRDLSDLNWGFALLYLVIVIPVVLVCWLIRRRSSPIRPDRA
jgi:hypothetical protein